MPRQCHACESLHVARRCPKGPTCTWVCCKDCKAVSGMVNGQPRYYVVPVG